MTHHAISLSFFIPNNKSPFYIHYHAHMHQLYTHIKNFQSNNNLVYFPKKSYSEFPSIKVNMLQSSKQSETFRQVMGKS